MKPDEYGILFEAEEKHGWFLALQDGLVRLLARHIPSPPSGTEPLRILDIGCGTGGTTVFVAEKTGATMISMDYSPHAVFYAKRRSLPALIRANIMSLPFKAKTFDAVLVNDVFAEAAVPSPLQSIREIRKVLKPTGIFIFHEPAFNWLFSGHDRATHTARRFTKSSMRRLLEKAGFEVKQITYWNFFFFFPIAAYRLVTKSFVSKESSSDLTIKLPAWLNAFMLFALRFENTAFLRGFSFPIGLSVFGVAKKALSDKRDVPSPTSLL